MKNAFSILSNYLPEDRKMWSRITDEITISVMFKERTSLCPKYAEMKGVYPIFVLPCINYRLIDDLLRKLYYPVFCATLSEFPPSVTQMAITLFEVCSDVLFVYLISCRSLEESTKVNQ